MDRVTSTPFLTKLQKFAEIPEYKLHSGRLYADLTFVYHSSVLSSTVEKVTTTMASVPFDQTNEFCSALNFLKNEIEQDDYQLLKNPLVRTYLPKVVNKLDFLENVYSDDGSKDIEYYLKCTFVWEKIYGLKVLIVGHLPVQREENNVPFIDVEYVYKFFYDFTEAQKTRNVKLQGTKDSNVAHLMHTCFLENLHEIKHINETTVDKLQYLLALEISLNTLNRKYTRAFISIDANSSTELLYKVVYCCTTLLMLSSLTEKQMHFFNFCLGLPELIGKELKVDGQESTLKKLIVFHGMFTAVREEIGKTYEIDFYSTEVKNLKEMQLRITFFSEVTQKFIFYLFPHLPSLVEDPQSLSMLQDIIKDPEFFNKLMKIGNGSIDKLHQAGFLTPEGENFRISDGWSKIITHFIPDYRPFLELAFLFDLPFSLVYSDNHTQYTNSEIFSRFLRGSSIENYPDYHLYVALSAERRAETPLLVSKLFTLDEVKTKRIKHLLEISPSNIYRDYLWLIIASLEAKNTTYLSICYSQYAKVITAHFQKSIFQDLRILNFSEEILLNTIQYINFKELETKTFKPLLRVNLFPQLTLNGLKVFMEKHSTINIKGIDVSQHDPRFTDFTLSESVEGEGQTQETAQKLYVSLDVLKRASEYFAGMYASGFKESGTDHVELGREDFAFFKRWMQAIYQPTNNFYAKHNQYELREKLFNRLRDDGMGVDIMEFCVEQLFLARSYQMNELFMLLDQVFSIVITLPAFISEEVKVVFLANLNRFDKLLKDKEKPSEFVSMVDQIANSQLMKKFNARNVP